MINILEDEVGSNLQRMVIVLRKLHMDQLQYHLISESQMTQEIIVLSSSDEANRK
jgi:hypothetical protein